MNNLDRSLRAMFQGADPTPADLDRTEQEYRRRIGHVASRRRLRRLTPAVFAFAAATALIGIVALKPSSVQAALTEIAHAARTVERTDLVDGEYYFTKSVSTFTQAVYLEEDREFVYRIDELRRVWINPSGSEIIVETTRTNPTFQTEADHNLYFALGLDAIDNLGTTQSTAVEGSSHNALEREWPREGDALLRTVREQPSVTTDTKAVDQLLDLITETPAPPDLRAATIEALSYVDLELVERTPHTVRFRTVPSAGDNQIIEFTLDSQGQLRHRTVINHDPAAPAADVVAFTAQYSQTEFQPLP